MATKSKTKVSVYLTPEVKAALEAVAGNTGRTLSKVMIDCFEKYLVGIPKSTLKKNGSWRHAPRPLTASEDGLTYAIVGGAFGVTRQRAHQVVQQYREQSKKKVA